jgi:hypothetical protein
MVRAILKLIVFVLIVHALYQFVPAYFNYHLFKDDVKQAALFAGEATDVELVQQILQHAEVRDIPLAREAISVRRVNNQLFVEAAYEQPVKVLPWYTYIWQVEVAENVMHVLGARR